MALFLSTFVNKVDKKGRVSVPANFRAALAEQKYQGIIAYQSFVNECIEACGMDRIERLSESIDSLDPYSDSRDAFAATILGGSLQLPFDSEGRVMLPEAILSEAGIDKKAVFVGKGATFEIWNPEAFEVYSAKARDLAKKERANLRLSAKKEGN
ncbi:MAG: mraZ [Rickettsiaceae bacterium]|jgi:MraZ protein|nr:mraZ [Rickettsiaceae bacterium]